MKGLCHQVLNCHTLAIFLLIPAFLYPCTGRDNSLLVTIGGFTADGYIDVLGIIRWNLCVLPPVFMSASFFKNELGGMYTFTIFRIRSVAQWCRMRFAIILAFNIVYSGILLGCGAIYTIPACDNGKAAGLAIVQFCVHTTMLSFFIAFIQGRAISASASVLAFLLVEGVGVSFGAILPGVSSYLPAFWGMANNEIYLFGRKDIHYALTQGLSAIAMMGSAFATYAKLRGHHLEKNYTIGEMKVKDGIIILDNVSKSFQGKKALNNISVSFDAGKIHGIIGRNGSGKTVMIKTICGLIRPDEGSVEVNGKRIGKDIDFPEDIGAIIEAPGFLPYQSGYQNLHYLASIRNVIGKDKIKNAMELVGLSSDDPKPVGKYSMGMKQRLGLAQAVMENPKILILDEPMNGLDNDGVSEIRQLILSLKEEGVTILLVSHNAEDIQMLCDTVHQMDRGVLL